MADRPRRNRGVALGVAGAGAAAALAASYLAARRHRGRGPVDLSHLALPDDVIDHQVPMDDGGEIHVVERGAGQPLVLLHGVTLSVDAWAYQLADLADRFRVIAVDQRGHGPSIVGAAGCSMERLALDVALVLEYLEVRDAVVVGHSMGGMVTQQLCLDQPDVARTRIAKTILLSTTAAIGQGVPGWQVMTGLMSPGAAAARVGSLRGEGWIPTGEVGYAIARLSHGSRADARHVLHTRNMTAAMTGSGLAAVLPAVARFDVRSRLHDYPVPALVITGSRDLLTPPRLGREIARRIPGAVFEVVPDGGHMLMFERREWLAERIVAYADS